jgi:hypothetical protein
VVSHPTTPDFARSSRDFAARIRPDTGARAWIISTGVCAYLAGFCLIAGLSMSTPWRLLLAAYWCGDAAISLYRFRRAATRLAVIRISPGGLQVLRQDGRRIDARLLTGTTIMRRLAWLRMAGTDGIRYQELVLASRTDPVEWHRLHLVWQLRGRGFGHTGAA